MAVPSPGLECTLETPPELFMHSGITDNPKPGFPLDSTAKPHPLSLTESRTVGPHALSSTLMDGAPASVIAFCKDSCAIRYRGRDTPSGSGGRSSFCTKITVRLSFVAWLHRLRRATDKPSPSTVAGRS